MGYTAMIIGMVFTLVEIVDVVVRLFPTRCGMLAIAGSIIFGAGIIAAAIEKKHSA